MAMIKLESLGPSFKTPLQLPNPIFNRVFSTQKLLKCTAHRTNKRKYSSLVEKGIVDSPGIDPECLPVAGLRRRGLHHPNRIHKRLKLRFTIKEPLK